MRHPVPDRAPGSRFRRAQPVTRVLLLGPPGGGKGTQGVRLSEALGVPHLSTGDLVRAEVAGGTRAGGQAKALMDRGELVPDELILELLTPALLRAADEGGFILDGFPRTVAQAEALTELLERNGSPLERAVYLDVHDDELTRRLLDRAQEQGRADDTPDVIARRLELFHSETQPLVDYYDARGLLERIDGARDVDRITREVLDRLEPGARTPT